MRNMFLNILEISMEFMDSLEKQTRARLLDKIQNTQDSIWTSDKPQTSFLYKHVPK